VRVARSERLAENIPYARNLELLKTPSKAKIADAIRKVCA